MLEEEMAGDGQRDTISGGWMVHVWNKTRLQWDSALGKMAPAAGRRHPRGDIKTTGCVYGCRVGLSFRDSLWSRVDVLVQRFWSVECQRVCIGVTRNGLET